MARATKPRTLKQAEDRLAAVEQKAVQARYPVIYHDPLRAAGSFYTTNDDLTERTLTVAEIWQMQQDPSNIWVEVVDQNDRQYERRAESQGKGLC